MALFYCTVIIHECNLDRFNISGDQNHALSKRVAMQGIYFSGAYFLMWVFWYVFIVMNTFFDAQPDWLWILNAIFMPIQGLYNLIVYLIPRYLRFRQEHDEHKGSYTLSTSFFSECESKVTVGKCNFPIEETGKMAVCELTVHPL